MGALIEFQRVSQFFATRGNAPGQALHDVSLDLAAGEFACLIGPSGCGKTTLLHLLAVFCSPPTARSSSMADGSNVPAPNAA